MDVAELDYELPPELIAQTPAEPRDGSRLLIIHRDSGLLEHRTFRDVREFFQPGDVLVANDSRVVPARLRGRKATGGAVEVLLLQPETPEVWRALIRPGRRVYPGTGIVFEPPSHEGHREGRAECLQAEVLERDDGAAVRDGIRRLRFSVDGPLSVEQALERYGNVPLPPYIHTRLGDPERYQTVYARPKGSVAAPTAGLHFTPELLTDLEERGVGVHYVTCHIGLHTFRPIQVDTVEQHDIHEELAIVPAHVAAACNAAREEGRRVFAVGTSSVRSLESCWRDGRFQPHEGWTRLYIYPSYCYRAVDAMITNFHLPRTTLMALIAAFAGKELILRAYREAVARRYRFYSFGDACLIL